MDGESINAGTVTITVYPFAEVTPPADGSCVTMVAASNCPNLMIGAASNATGGVDLANWDAATGIYTAQGGDAPGTFDVEVTGGTAPCDMGTITVSVPMCDGGGGDPCTTLTPADDAFELCGGTTPDLAAIEAAILGSVGDATSITGVVEWYTDADLTMPYTVGGAINHSDSDAAGTCDPGTVILYAEVVCLDGVSIDAGTVTITVYPFAEVQPGAGCSIAVTAPNCPNLMIGAASNATGGASLGNWDAATNTYTGQIGDAAGTIDVEVTGGTAPCDAGTITINIPECIDDTGDDCTTVTEIADAVDLCGGLEPDLASSEATILGSVGDASLITGTVNWYFDAGFSMPYGGGVINHADTGAAGTCDAGTVVLYAEILCVDGGSIDAGTVTVTVYPFGPEIDAGSDCVVSVTPPNCPNLTINAATNPTGGASLGNWDAATNTYTGQDGDFPGTLDIVITGGLPPCETGTYVLQIPGCGDDVPCTTTTEPTETLEICGGLTPDLTSIEAAILAGLGDPSLVTGVVWYTDAGYTMPYDGGQVNHSNTSCDEETVTLYAQVVCLTGFEFPAGQVDITVYPFGPSVDTDGCILTLTPPNCPSFSIGMVSNATGGADLANWDAATNTYIAQDGDAAGTIDIEITGGTSPCESGTYTLEIGTCGFDLALTKTLSAGQAAVVGPGADVSFDITVVNQGTDDAFNVVVTDYIPAGYAFDPASNPAWGDSDGDGNPDQTVAGPIAPGASQTITITLTVMNPFNGTMTDLVNIAEISAADDDNDPNNTPPTDIDSTPNTDPTDDAGGTPGGADDDSVDGDGTGTPGDGNENTDEDDHDPAFVDVDPNLGGEGCTTLTPAADALELCGGLTPDLAGIESAILASVGDMTLITGDINWYFDGAFTMPYDDGQVNHSNTNCDAETVVLYAEVVCADGSGIEAGTVTITVYPFGPTVDADGCVAVLTAPSCPNFTIGAASNPTGGVSLANWDAATNTYTAQDGDQAGTLDIEITGGTAPCESGIYTLEIGSCGFDLALIKTLSSGQASTVAPGDNVSFTITVTNQGSEDAFNVVVTDYVPAGYNFDAALNPAWGDSDGDGNPDQTIAGPLATGASQIITITLTVADPFMGSTVDLVNVAEISAADDDNDPNNAPPTDVDSTPNTDPTDDAGGTPGGADDDYVDGNGSGNPNDGVADTDEDDHDPAFVNIDGVGDPCTTSTMPVETLTACGGVAPDLSTIEAAILAGIGDPSLITGEVVWYTDANYMTVYDGGPIDHDDSSAGGTCDPGILTLYAQVVCVDGTASFAAGQVDLTVYPFGPSITPTGPGCILVIEPACPGDIIGAVSNATGGASIENWDPATNTYTAYEGDLPGSIDIEITSSVPGSPCSGVYTLEIPQCGEPDEVPTVGEWGLIILGLLMAIVAVAGIRQRSTEEEYHTS